MESLFLLIGSVKLASFFRVNPPLSWDLPFDGWGPPFVVIGWDPFEVKPFFVFPMNAAIKRLGFGPSLYNPHRGLHPKKKIEWKGWTIEPRKNPSQVQEVYQLAPNPCGGPCGLVRFLQIQLSRSMRQARATQRLGVRGLCQEVLVDRSRPQRPHGFHKSGSP